MATLIGSTLTIDEVAESTRSTGSEVLTTFGSRFHLISTPSESLGPKSMQN